MGVVNVWRRQRLPLIALAVTAIAAVGVHVWLDVLPASSRGQQTITVVDAESPAEVAGYTIALDSARWSEFEAPDGSRTLSIRLDSRAGADATTCGTFSLTEVDGGRVWENARSALDVPSDAGERGCQAESATAEILAVFLLPDSADGPFWLDIPGDGSEVARFPVEP